MPDIRVLSFGHDRRLLAKRSRELINAGFDVVETYSPLDALRLADLYSTDVLLICSTVPRAEQRGLIKAVKVKRRLLPVFCVIGQDYAVRAEGPVAFDQVHLSVLEAVRSAAYPQPRSKASAAA